MNNHSVRGTAKTKQTEEINGVEIVLNKRKRSDKCPGIVELPPVSGCSDLPDVSSCLNIQLIAVIIWAGGPVLLVVIMLFGIRLSLCSWALGGII